MNLWGWLATLEWFELLLFYLTLSGTIIILVFTIGKILRGKTIDLKNQKITDNTGLLTTDNISQHLEVRDYRYLLMEAYEEVGKEILLRFKQNGWLSLGDWPGYVTEMINYSHDSNTRFLDEHYYFAAILRREDLYDWNLLLSPVLEQIYRELFENLKAVMAISYSRIDEFKTQLKELEDARVCEVGQRKCPIFIHVMKLSTDIVMEEYVKMPERAKTEIQRVMTRIVQEQFGHFLKKYKSIIEAREKN